MPAAYQRVPCGRVTSFWTSVCPWKANPQANPPSTSGANFRKAEPSLSRRFSSIYLCRARCAGTSTGIGSN